MKKMYSVVLMVLINFGTFSQSQETLFNGIESSGGYGGPMIMVGALANDVAVYSGGFGGWFVNKKLTIGGGGASLISENQYDQSFGGFHLAYTLNSDRLVHPHFTLFVGGGEIEQESEDGLNVFEDGYFMLLPGVQGDLNVLSFMRVGIGMSYMQTFGVNLDQLSDSDMTGLMGTFSIKFGFFGQ